MQNSRRSFLASGAALAAAGLAGCAQFQSALRPVGVPPASSPLMPAVSRPAPGVARMTMGGVTLTALSDGEAARPLADGFVRDVPLAQVQGALRDAGLPTETLTIPFTTFVVEANGRRILMDTGNGQFGAPTSGRALASMAAAGIDPASIDTVAITHFHGDHINGLRDREGKPVYPKAKVLVPKPEWDFWMDDARMGAAPEAMRGAFQGARRVFASGTAMDVDRFDPGASLAGGLESMPAYGHTPGHTAFSLRVGNRRIVYWGDLTNIAALFVRNPDWAVQFDMDPNAARTVRRAMMERAVTEDWIVAGYHLPFPAFGRIVRRGGGYDFQPLA